MIPRRILALAATLVALAAPCFAQDPAPARYIAVEGAGSATAVPDTAELAAGVTSRAQSARAAMALNNAAMEKVLAAVRAAGIAERAVRTSRLTVSPVYDRNGRRNEPRAPVAYQASNEIDVTVTDIGHVGALIDALVAAGANQVRGIRFVVKDVESIADAARRAALADARRRAALYADAAGLGLGAILRIEERQMHVPVARMMASTAAQDTPVMPGEQTVRAVVVVRFAIE